MNPLAPARGSWHKLKQIRLSSSLVIMVFAGAKKSQVPEAHAGLRRLDCGPNERPFDPIDSPQKTDACQGRGFVSASFFFPGESFSDER